MKLGNRILPITPNILHNNGGIPMIVRAKMFIAFSLIALAVVVLSLHDVSFAATSPTVTILNPLSNGLNTPSKIALDSKGNIFVTDGRAGGVLKFDTYGTKLLTIRLNALASGLAFEQDGTLIVAQGTFVARYNPVTGEELGRFTGGHLVSSAGVAVNNVTGYIYVADSRSKEIEVYNATGQYVTAFGNTILAAPSGITYEKSSGYLAVCDYPNNKVHFFDVNGNYTYSSSKSFGDPIPGGRTAVYSGSLVPMQFASATAVTFEYSNDPVPVLSRIYVLDSFQGNVQVVDPVTLTPVIVVGSYNNYIGSLGGLSGQLLAPSDVLFDKANSRLLVSNSVGNLTIYGIDGGKNPIYVDTTPPTLTVNPLLSTVSVPTITISGTVESGASVAVTTSTAVVGAVLYPSATTWQSEITALSPGDNIFIVTAKDVVGNTTPEQSVSTKYQLPAPTLTVTAVQSPTKMLNFALTGTVDIGATVLVTNTGTALSGSAVVTDTRWSYTVALVEGINSITVEAQKPFSDKAKLTTAITLDTIPPVLTVSALSNGSYTSTKVQNIAGNVSDAGAVSVLVNNLPAELATNNTFSVPFSLQNGENAINVVAIDAAGNQIMNTRKIIFDEDKPVLTILSPMDNSYTSTPLTQITGSVTESSTIAVNYVGAPATVTVDSNNNWTASVVLTSGLNTVEVVATDSAGNASVSMKRSITLDTASPTLAITSPPQDIATKQASINVIGTISDDNSISITCSVSGLAAPIQVNAGVFNCPADFVKEGTYPVVITATDAAGNIATSTRSLIYDVTPPLFAINAVPASVSLPSLSITGTVETGVTLTVKTMAPTTAGPVVYTSATTWETSVTGLVDGYNIIVFTATDVAGNTTEPQSVTTELITSVVKPAIAITSPLQDFSTNQSIVSIKGIVKNATKLAYTVNGKTFTILPAAFSSGTYSFKVTFTKQGTYPLVITASDASGNTATATRNIIFDTTPPLLTLNTVTAAAPTTIGGTVEPGAIVDVKLGSTVKGKVTVIGNLWSCDMTGVNYTSKQLSVTAKDAAGNSTIITKLLK